MKKSFCIIAALFCLFCISPYQSVYGDTLNSSEVKKYLDYYTLNTPSKAGAIALLHSNTERQIIVSGYANKETKAAITADSRFHIASLTKMFTAVIIYQLIEEGHLALDTKISSLLDTKVYEKIDNFNATTIKMLLEHSSGIPDFIGSAFDEAAIHAKNHNWSAEEALSFIQDTPSHFKAGSEYAYNSTGYVLLGGIFFINKKAKFIKGDILNSKIIKKIEKWKPHPTRKNIFINQKNGLLYRRLEGGWFDQIDQKMTLHQELEIYRKLDGVVRMTSRSRGRVAPPSDQTPDEDHT